MFPEACKFIKKFSANFAKFLRTPIFLKHLWWLLLKKINLKFLTEKMLATMVDRRKKYLKKHWLKCSKAVPQKTKIGSNINDSKSHIWNSFYENIISGMQLFIFVQTFQRTYQSFFNFRFFNRKSQSQQKPAKKITHFTIQLFRYFYP